MEDDDGSPKTTVKIEIRGAEEGGSPWNDGVYSTVRRILINHREWICSIHVEYDKNGKSDWGSKHGGNEGYTSEVVLDYPNEYLISICGYYGDIRKWRISADVIRSLTLHTNRKTYGPFGMEEGTKFSFPVMGAKIVGFHGRCGWFLDAIGLYIQPIPKNQLKNFSLAPCGGKGGDPWECVFRAIRQLVISHELWIHSIQMQYEDKNGKLVWSKKHGSRDGSSRSEVVLEFPDEYFVSVHGYYGDLHNFGNAATVIRSLTLETNRRTYGPFGVEDGTKFSFPVMGTKIVGFHGRSGWYLDAIGLYLGTPQKSKPEPQLQLEPEPEHRSFGPYGGVGGDSWHETFFSIRRLVVHHGLWIDSIQIEYEADNGAIMLSKKHGGNGGSRSEVVFEFPGEHLVSIHGYYSDLRQWGSTATLIRSLTLKTNKRTYGPFGVEDGTKFSFPTIGMKIIGIHGRSGLYLDAIGLLGVLIEHDGYRNPAAWDDGVYSTIRRLVVYEREWICSIQIEYDQNGESIWSPKHGGNDGSISEVVLDYPDEYVISIYGFYGDLHNWGIDATVIRSLTLETNLRSYGPFGVEDGTEFSFPITGAKIVGFHGNSGRYLHAIGVHVQTTQKIGPQPEAQPKRLDLGQYGGNGGDHWEETFHRIRRLVIYHGLWIDSIQMEYEDEKGKSIWSEKHGGGGGFRSEVVLELDEHLVLIHGYYSNLRRWGIDATVIRSLTLKTSKRSYGPFGIEDGTKFSFPFTGLKIVGFHGRSSLYLDAIGLFVRGSQINGPEKYSLGECGGEGGDPWNESFEKMKKLVIYHGLWVDSIQMEYEDENQELVWSEKHGGNGGSPSEVVLDFPDEHVVTIHGYYDDVHYWGYNCTVIRSLTVETNKRTYGPFGVEDGTKFSFPSVGMKVVGIHGRSGVYLDAIGLDAIPIKD
ncbi:jacalin-related lectin 3-like [Momordica charantia]|uniref:Jacalin-related lectin 3-like n=1 Tax=Momordica charantia TaxID=3673 RepID=A0A6J1C6X3_MOMCH|nr:jacalin-related lectin 3-like [Momordica charantia]